MGRKNRFLRAREQEVVDRIKFQVVRSMERLQVRRQWDQKTMAAHLGTTASRLSEIGNKKFKRVSLDQLFRYLAKLEPRVEILISI